MKKKVYVGLSGGVDSAVSATLLKRSGYDVTGVFIKVWQPDWIECTWKEDRRDAMRVAAYLDIPFITLDLEDQYKHGVIDYMISEYRNGKTPNPDVMCNREVKFGAFWKWAESHGADYIATGHYARIACATPSSGGQSVFVSQAKVDTCPPCDGRGACKLLAGLDSNKDQSYFLWTLTQNDLKHILFPVGDLTKPQVRTLAEKYELPNANKKDSQGLCFVGKIDIKDFLKHYIGEKRGDVLDETGEIIGSHSGSMFFTIGERHGFTIDRKTSNDQPYFVIDKDIELNTITVSNRLPTDILPGATKISHICRVNWISGEMPPITDRENIFPLQARSRYREKLQNIAIKSANFVETTILFEKPQDTLTGGQSIVIYDGDVCLGGGIIA